jgi:hypothetical protein
VTPETDGTKDLEGTVDGLNIGVEVAGEGEKDDGDGENGKDSGGKTVVVKVDKGSDPKSDPKMSTIN